MTTKTNCIIIDDEPLGIELLAGHIEKIPELELIASFRDPTKAMATLVSQKVDLIFLDIQMPEISGMQFAKSLSNPPPIIFTTAYRNYAVESYELNVVDYLLKPIGFSRFVKAFSKFQQQQAPKKKAAMETKPESEMERYIFLNTNKKFIKVAFEDIRYVESLKDYLRVHTKNSQVVTKGKIGEFKNKLPSNFIRIHRSFIVNIDHVTAFTAHDIEIDQVEIPIGGSYKENVLEKLR